VIRAPRIHWLQGAWMREHAGPLRPIIYPSTDIGPPGLNLIVAAPHLYRRLPLRVTGPIARRTMRPAGAQWLIDRLRNVPLRTGHVVVAATPANGALRVALDDGSVREANHLLLATGYQIDVAKYAWLSAQLVEGLRRENGYPILGRGLESSVPGLHFVGAPSSGTFGPVMRVLSGARFAAPALTRAVTRR
jgi:hypothetical protein